MRNPKFSDPEYIMSLDEQIADLCARVKFLEDVIMAYRALVEKNLKEYSTTWKLKRIKNAD